MTTRILLLSLVFLCCKFSINGQNRGIPVGMVPTNHNGGFAGEAGVPRVTSYSYLNFVDADYYTEPYRAMGSLIAVDNFFKGLRSGIGITAGIDGNSWSSKNTTSSVSMAISPKLSSKGKYTIAPFVDMTFQHAKYTVTEDVGNTDTIYIKAGKYHWDYLNCRIGALVNFDKMYVGLTANIFDRYWSPNYGIFENSITTRLFSKITYGLQAGYTFQRRPDSRFSFTPQVYFSFVRVDFRGNGPTGPITQKYFTSLNYSLVFRVAKFITGINSSGVMVGYQSKRFKLQCSNYTNFSSEYQGALSLRYTMLKDPTPKISGF